ncbi:deoxyribonuclease [Marinobacterium zhoushanense]|uniref:Deoxyribonuclease n=1 Tax=Marinobacterium zhoushanense TaxID=1679163 RepID=A0ABQ1KE71_9GAMM|nr:TatD family hydrolase [Marinobacterium zhoushanense]GGB92876.1 deoxyribonuclease [Marinobacterium zhoushanense]
MFIDSHCHLDRLDLGRHDGSLANLIQAAGDAGVEEMLCVAIDLNQFEEMYRRVKPFGNVYASAGIHPCHVGECPFDKERLREAASRERIVALGETGLDYYYSKELAEQQRESFAGHLQLGSEFGLPVIVHTRDAREDTLDVIREHADPNVAGVLHCFTESREMALAALELNFYISFSGIITFRNAEELRDVVRAVPLDKMLIETDSPYLAPVPYRGKQNEPTYVPEVARCIADVKGLRIEEVAEATRENFYQLFTKARSR